MSTANRVIKNTLFLYMRTIVSLLLGVFTTRVLLEALGESDFGLYNVVGGSIAMMGFLSASMSSATQRFLSYAEGQGLKDKIRQYFNNSVIIHWGLAGIMVLILAIAGIFFFNGVLNIPQGKFTTAIIIYLCLVVSTVFSITIVPYEAEINAHENMLFFSILGISDVVAKFLIAFAVLYIDSEKLIIYAVLMAAESFLLRFVSQMYCRRKYEECRQTDLKKYYSKSIIKEMTSFAGWNLANIGTGLVSLYGMNVVVNHYFGTDVNAAMGIATQLSGVMMGLSANMLKAVTPIIVKSEGGNEHQKMLQYSYVSCKFSYLIFSIVCIPVLFYIKPILTLWLTVVPNWTAILCVILIIATLIDQLTVVLYQSIMAVGNIGRYNVARSISNLSPLVISIIMFQLGDFPPYWILINWGIWKSLFGGGINIIFAKILTGLKFSVFIRSVFLPAVSGTITSTAIFLLLNFDGLAWGMNMILGSLLSLPVYFFLTLNSQERNKVLTFIPRKICRL